MFLDIDAGVKVNLDTNVLHIDLIAVRRVSHRGFILVDLNQVIDAVFGQYTTTDGGDQPPALAREESPS